MKNLIVVESPTKAKKINTFFKDGTMVISSFGHIIDLPKKEISIDIENNFEPSYKPIDGKKDIIKKLKSLSKNYNVLLAADNDREGDAIAWHCGNIMNLNFNDNNRILFNEISKKAIMNSIKNVHQLNINSVNAQQGRRILDRLVGYSLSPLLWKHIDSNVKGLSAGRVQSTLLLILKENENSINNHNYESHFEYIGKFNDNIICDFNNIKNINQDELFNLMKNNKNYLLIKQYHKEEKKYSPPPFITSSLQTSAQNELGFNVKTTMNIAQKLFENGKITYMRTDSTFVSNDFQREIYNFISDKFGDNYYIKRVPNHKVKGAQEAHECIRVTNINESLNDKYTDYDKKLFNLIKKRTIISHMKPAIYDNLIFHLSNDNINNYGDFKGIKKQLIFDGFLKYSDNNLKLFDKCEELNNKNYLLNDFIGEEIIKNPPQYPNESSIVKKLEKSGIGRPSTYASLISTLYNRNYTEIKTIKGKVKQKYTITLNSENVIIKKKDKQLLPDQKNRIVLTDLGKQVLEYLMNHFSMIINIEFTSKVESDLDLVANGEILWQDVVRKVYDSFKDNLFIQKQISSDIPNKSNNQQINLGKFNNNDVILKNGPYGPYINYKKKNISLTYYLKNNPTEFNNILLDDIIDIIKYPLKLGKYEKKDIIIQIGPYGKYMKYNNRNYKIPQKDNYTLEECIRKIN